MSPPLRIDPWRLEALKRELDALPQWLGESRRVRLAGLPPLYDIEGQFRLAGLRALLDGLGAQCSSLRKATTIWLGWGERPAEAHRLLLWPAPGSAVQPGPGILLPLPDPMHALWGLLEHYPPGKGRLELPERPDWRGLLPLLARIPPGLPVPGRLRRAVLNRAQRLIRAHAEVATSRPTGAILAALLGRAAILSSPAEASWMERQH
jgi:hypothetical protein